jgi:hypothetical protein
MIWSLGWFISLVRAMSSGQMDAAWKNEATAADTIWASMLSPNVFLADFFTSSYVAIFTPLLSPARPIVAVTPL